MATIPIFHTPIYISEFTGDHNLSKAISEEVNKNIADTPLNKPWPSNVEASFEFGKDSNFLSRCLFLRHYILEHVKIYMEGRNLRLLDSWVNVYGKDGYQEFHRHIGLISGCYYHKAPANCGELILRSDSTGQKMFGLYNYEDFKITPEDGMLVLFPSYLEHAVRSNSIEESRISIAFNLNL